MSRPPILTVGHSVRRMVEWFLGFLTLTEAEQLKAGIYLRGKDRDQ